MRCLVQAVISLQRMVGSPDCPSSGVLLRGCDIAERSCEISTPFPEEDAPSAGEGRTTPLSGPHERVHGRGPSGRPHPLFYGSESNARASVGEPPFVDARGSLIPRAECEARQHETGPARECGGRGRIMDYRGRNKKLKKDSNFLLNKTYPSKCC